MAGSSRLYRAQKKDWSGVKIVLVGVFFSLALGVLWTRAFYVQLVLGDNLAERSRGQYWVKEVAHGERGEILDRNGVLLAKSIVVKSVFARPEQILDKRAASGTLARILGMPVHEVRRKLEKKGFVWIARKIDDLKALRVKQADLAGVYLSEEKKRFYPQGRLAGQLLGFVGIDNQGLEGLELSFDRYLAGGKREFWVQRDARGHLLYAPGQLLDQSGQGGDGLVRATRGQDLFLTLDAGIQNRAELALSKAVGRSQAKRGQCLVVYVPTGEILAWAMYPFFNPNTYQRVHPGLWKNRIALDVFEPGSTMKPFLVAAALEEGLVSPRDIIFCENGSWFFAGHRLDDTHKYGWLTVSKIIRYSSNIGAAKIGLRLGAEKLSAYLDRLGIGHQTGLPLPAESAGTLRPYQQWHQIDLATASFGQGLAMTSLQLAQAYLCLASKGTFLPLRVVLHPASRRSASVHRVFSRKTALAVLSMLLDVVAMDGTGTRARIPGVQIGGKTGTAQKADPKGGYGKKYVASFVGIFPALDPRFLVLTVIDEPRKSHYGGVVAAPAVKEVTQQILAMYPLLQGNRLVLSKKDPPALRAISTGKTRVKGGDPLRLKGLSLRRAVELLARQGIHPELKGSGVWVKKKELFSKGQGQKCCMLWLTDRLPTGH